MKAIHITEWVKDYSELCVRTIPPPSPSDRAILVDIAYAAIQHVDLLYCRGKHQNNHSGLVKPPFTLGLEFSGVVAEAPAGSAFKRGDRVFGGGVGAFAEQYAATEAQISRVPEGWTLRDAAGVGNTAAVSYGAVVRCGGLQAGETVLVHAAAGGLGVMACQIAKGLGARVVATVGSEEKAEIVRRMGVADVVRYDRKGWEKEVLKVTGGKGVDLVYDTVGLVEESIRCVRFRGRVVIAGFAGREGVMERLAMNRVLLKNVQLLGYRYGETGRRYPEENVLVWDGLTKMINQGLIKPMVYGERFEGLESVPRALQLLADRKIWGKGVVEVQPDLEHTKSKL